MIKWGGRKSSSSSSSSSGPSHASPFSWLSKLKHMRMNSDPDPNKMKQKGKQNSTSVASPSPPIPPECSGGNNDGDTDRFCGRDDHDGSLLRQSFNEEIQGDKKSKDTYENVIQYSSRNAKKHGRRQGQETLKLKEKDNGLEDERKLVNDDRKIDEYDREKEYENIRRRFERKAQQVLEEQLLKLERDQASKAAVEDVQQFESPRTICTPRTHSFVSSAELKSSSLRNIIEDRVSQKKLISSERQNYLKQTEELDLKVKTHEKQKPSQLRRRKPKIRIYSPRMVSKVEACRIKALEDMRKAAKLNKMKKERREESTKPAGGDLDSFAVIKCSLDPRKDFRDSMIEMIMEKNISKAEEMEELLACYLTLNADEYHDLIIKVFRQVWFDMSQHHGFGIKSADMQWAGVSYDCE